MSVGDDPRLRAFARGELHGTERQALEAELETSQALRDALASLASTENAPTLASDSRPAPSAPRGGLTLGRELGRGGMAIVSLAVQADLAREVAVKRARPDRATHADQLVQEARLTGALEHPAIVPVHFLTFDGAGQPLVVLKRVEGEPWSAFLRQPSLVAQRTDEPALEWHLRVLATVCDALAFAHARGILHRDVKPANVMIGAFGEVYVTDWGLGGTVTPDPEGRWPCVADSPGAGTPAYMAPEQVRLEPLAVTTDVWLAGACLYEVLFGVPPFAARATLDPRDPAGVHASFPPGPRADLVAVAKRALAPAPAERFQSMRELRAALDACARHSASELLTARARRVLDDARGRRAALQGREADALVAEAQYALRAALELWPESQTALELKAELTEQRVGWALADDQPSVAQALLREHPSAPPALVERVGAAVLEAERLRAKAQSLDPALGRQRRFSFVAGVALLMVAFNGVRLVWPEFYAWRWSLTAASVAFLVGFASLSAAHRALLNSSALNLQLARVVLVTTLVQVSTRTTAAIMGWSRGQALTVDLSVIALAMLLCAGVFHWAFAVGAAVCFVGQAVALSFPRLAEPAFAVTSIAAVFGAGVCLHFWGRRGPGQSGGLGANR